MNWPSYLVTRINHAITVWYYEYLRGNHRNNDKSRKLSLKCRRDSSFSNWNKLYHEESRMSEALSNANTPAEGSYTLYKIYIKPSTFSLKKAVFWGCGWTRSRETNIYEDIKIRFGFLANYGANAIYSLLYTGYLYLRLYIAVTRRKIGLRTV